MDIREVISGKRQGLAPSLVRVGLSAMVPFNSAAVNLRNLAYDRGWREIYRAAWPVISIGNLTTGGTGKTPMVAWLAQRLIQLGRRPVLLSRGYKSLDGSENDEKRLLDQLCPGVPHLQDRDRVRAAQMAEHQGLGDVFVLDDGFQHRRLHRELDIVLIDAVEPWGHGRMLPRGLLREPMRSLSRADVVVVTRSELATAEQLARLRNEISKLTNVPIIITQFEPAALISSEGEWASLKLLRDTPGVACCGIGNPAAFEQTLRGIAGQRLSGFRTFPDHHHYTESDIQELERWCSEQGGQCIVTTRKDLVKLNRPTIGTFRLWAVDIELQLVEGEQPLHSAIEQALERGSR